MLIGLVLLHSPLPTFLIFSPLPLSPARTRVCKADLHILNQGSEKLMDTEIAGSIEGLGAKSLFFVADSAGWVEFGLV